MKFSTWELVPDITDYKLEFITQKFQTMDPIWRTKIIFKKVSKTKNAKKRQNFGLIKLQNFYGNITSFFSTHFILKLLITIFQ